MRKQWHDDVSRLLRQRGHPPVEGKNLVEYDYGEVRLCRFDGVHGESVERVFREDGELGRIKRDDSGHLLEVCRHCGDDLRLPRDGDGLVDRSAGGQREYCSPDCKRGARNARDRRRRARRRPAAAVRFTQRGWVSRSDPDTTGIRWTQDDGPIVPPCWSADPWLKFWLKGSVPIGKGRFIDYADPTGAAAVRLVERPDLRPMYLEETGPGVPVGKPMKHLEYRHNVFDHDFAGIAMGYYQRLVLAAGKW